MKPKVLITDAVHEILPEGLRQMGFEVDYRPTVSADTVWQLIPQYEGLVVNSRVPADAKLLQRGARLKFVCRVGSGLEVIDAEFAASRGIAAFNSPEGNRLAVAEHALGMLLAMLNNLVVANNAVKQGLWPREQSRGTQLSGKTMGLIAYGNNAQEFAKVLGGFDVSILAYDKYFKGFGDGRVREAELPEIFQEADVLSIHLPLTPETEYMIDYGFLSQFKKPIWLINISRGKVLRTADLIRCLNEGRILGAALDVLENEKLDTLSEVERAVFQQLVADSRVILSPHVAGWTYESKQKLAEVLLHKIKALYGRS